MKRRLFECFHRKHDGHPMSNGWLHGSTPREALALFKAITPTARTHFVILVP